MTTIKSGAASDVGRVRQINEDRYLARDDLGLYAVADGVGGHQAGEVASQTSVETLETAFVDPSTDGLVEAIKAANQAVWHLAQQHAEKRGMGTTMSAVALVLDDGEEHLAVANVGDSRVYLFRQNEMDQLTDDHSLVEELVREGQLSRDEAAVHPQRSVITRALGMEPAVEVDSWQLLPVRGDRFLLCTDGLTNEVTDDQIASTLRRIADADDVAHDLVRQARAHGGNDNITVVVVDVLDDDQRAERASAALAAEPVPIIPPPGGSAPSGPGGSGGSSTTAVDADLATTTTTVPRATAGPTPTAEEPRPRRLTWRVGAFLMVLAVVVAVAVIAVGWYARGTYYVGIDGDRIAIYKGRPGGLLWFQPTLEERKPLTTADVLPAHLPDLRSGQAEPTKAAADRYVNQLRQEAAQAKRPPPAPPPSTPPPGPA